MAAIYRFGFENSRVPNGVSITKYSAWAAGRFTGTTALSNSGSNTGAIVNMSVSGSYVATSFFCWLSGSLQTTENPANADFTVASFYGNSVGFSKDTLWIKTESGIVHRVSKEELAGTLMVSGVHYYTTAEFKLGVEGYIAFYWDGLRIEFSGNTGAVPVGINQLSVQCPAFANDLITPEEGPSYWYGAVGYLDDIAVNDGNGLVDIGVPDPVACFPATELTVVSNTGWTPSSDAQLIQNLYDSDARTVVSSQTKGAVLNVGFATNVPITKTGFEGINIYLDGMSKTGSGRIGMRWGWFENGINFQGGDDINLGYVGTSRSLSKFYRTNVADPQNLEKFSVEDGEALATYFEVI